MTKFVISGYIGFDNFGDEAIVKVLTSYLKKLGVEKITVLSSNPSKTSKLYDVYSQNYLDFFKPILESDVLISGGGSLLQDVTSLKSLIYYLAVIVTALVFNKKVIIFAQGFTPFRTSFGKIFTQFVLKYCNAIYVRDKESCNLLKEMNLDSKIISDPVFSIETSENKNKKGLGIQLRSCKNLTEEFLNDLAKSIEKSFEKQEIKLFSLQDSLDLQVLKIFSKKLEAKGFKTKIYQNLSVEDVIKEISSLEFLIGMRFHSLLVAAKSGVKVLGINYDIKVENLSKKIKFPTINLTQKSLDNKIEKLKNLDIESYKIPNFEFPEI